MLGRWIEYKIQLGSPSKVIPQNKRLEKGDMRDQHVCQRKKRSSSITRTPLLICFQRELSLTTPRHAVMSYRWVRCAIQYTRQTTAKCHWGLGVQQQASNNNKQANNQIHSRPHIYILFVSYIHSYIQLKQQNQ